MSRLIIFIDDNKQVNDVQISNMKSIIKEKKIDAIAEKIDVEIEKYLLCESEIFFESIYKDIKKIIDSINEEVQLVELVIDVLLFNGITDMDENISKQGHRFAIWLADKKQDKNGCINKTKTKLDLLLVSNNVTIFPIETMKQFKAKNIGFISRPMNAEENDFNYNVYSATSAIYTREKVLDWDKSEDPQKKITYEKVTSNQRYDQFIGCILAGIID